MTGQALEVMEQCQVIAGYTVYVELVRGLFPHKEFLTTAMTREEERCRKAFDCCMEGKNTAMICSGDAGFMEWRASYWNWQSSIQVSASGPCRESPLPARGRRFWEPR